MKRHSLFGVFFILTVFSGAFGGGTKDGKQDQEEKETRPAQVTFITPLGTNGIEAPQIENKFSLNMLAGVNGGVDGVEIGGLVNVITGQMAGAQFAGLGNYVHQGSSGWQLGGIFNVSRGPMNGGQFAGLANLSTQNGEGTQLAGLLNVNNGTFKGFQAAGLVNVSSSEVDGVQLGGLVNYTGSDVSSGQIAGLVNVGLGNTHGIQLAGLISVSGKAHQGSQFSGVVNIATVRVSGSQMSGIVNYSKKVNGIQIGLINVADSAGGAQIGLISYAGNGHMSLGVETNETFHGQLTFKMGLKKLYNIYSVGAHDGANRYWAPGFGLGTFLAEGQKTALNLEGVVYNVNEDEWWTDELNMLVRLNVNYLYRVTPHFSFTAGISLNEAISQVRDAEGALTGGSFTPEWTFYEYTGKRTKTVLYPGFNLGLAFRIK